MNSERRTAGAVRARALQQRGLALAAGLLALTLLGGCRTTHTRLTIRGGPSLDALFSELAKAYEQSNPGATVVCDFTCPPCVLLKRPGAIGSFDLFASLGQFELEQLTQHGQVAFAEAQPIGTTTLSLVTSTRSTADLKTIADLHRGKVRKIGVGDPATVGVGYYAKQALAKAGLWEELKGRFVYSQSGCELLKWLGLGRDIDAAIVFSVCSGDEHGSVREVIEFPRELIPPVPLLLARPKDAGHSEEAKRFIEFARSDAAKAILSKYRVGVTEAGVDLGRATTAPQPGLAPRPQGWKPCSSDTALAAGSRSYGIRAMTVGAS